MLAIYDLEELTCFGASVLDAYRLITASKIFM